MPQVQTLKAFSNDQVPARDGHRLLAARATVRATVRATRGRREVCSMDARPRREQKVGTLQAHGDSQPVRTGLAAQACCAGVRCTRRRAARVLKPSHGAQYYKVGPRRTKRTPRKSCDCTSRPTHLRLCDLFPHLLQEWTARGTRCRLFVCVGAAHRGGAACEHACKETTETTEERCREQREKRVIFTIPRVQGAPPTEIGLDPDG